MEVAGFVAGPLAIDGLEEAMASEFRALIDGCETATGFCSGCGAVS